MTPRPEPGPSELQALRSAGLVSARGYAAAIDAVRDESFWARWGMRALLALGVGQFLAGVVFFFAYNWNDLSDIAKFAVIEVALAVAVAGALLIGLDRVFGQMLLIAASVLTGVLLAVIGQVYQTGADVFELFTVWAVFILPWTIISRHPVHWLLWLVVAEVAFVLYADQVLVPIRDMPGELIWTIVGATVAVALAAREWAVWRGRAWLAGHWTRLVLLFAAMAALFGPAAAQMFDVDHVAAGIVCVAAFLLSALATLALYWRRWRDFPALVIVIGFVDAFVVCVGYRVIDEGIGFDLNDVGPALSSLGAMIAWAIAATGSAALVMRRLRGSLQEVAS
ncbi:MAG TPA: DUF2157 domain-containing protein [Dongiaceae bacterium]|nr:DUF2157 domain-containing protein [Dongiaceae bacterium]